MLKTIVPDEGTIAGFVEGLRRDQLPYHEYHFFDPCRLKEYLIADILSHEYRFAVKNKSTVTGIITCNRNDFDSEIFGFHCYNISTLAISCDENRETSETVSALISGIEHELSDKGKPFHITISLNNNTQDTGQILNAVLDCGYYYIHTLLTFAATAPTPDIQSLKGSSDIIIRKAVSSDADEIAEIARRSFVYSRFHMDPFLPSAEADQLHFQSAKNSLLNGYVDVMFVAVKKGKIIGYYSGKKHYDTILEKTIGKAVISAVDDAFRGMGIFSILDSHLLNWFSDNCDFAEMGTYLVNHAVHRTWIKKGLDLVRGVHQLSKFVSA